MAERTEGGWLLGRVRRKNTAIKPPPTLRDVIGAQLGARVANWHYLGVVGIKLLRDS